MKLRSSQDAKRKEPEDDEAGVQLGKAQEEMDGKKTRKISHSHEVGTLGDSEGLLGVATGKSSDDEATPVSDDADTPPAVVVADTRTPESFNADHVPTATDKMKFILEQLGRHPNDILPRLHANGITSVEALLAKKPELEGRELVGINKKIQKELALFCLWYTKFCKEHSSSVAWQQHFDEDSLEDIESESKHTSEDTLRNPALLRTYATHTLHDDEDRPFLKGLSEHEFEEMYNCTATKVINLLPEELKAECHFPLKDYAMKWIKAIFNLPTGKPYPKVFLNSGKTQAGKTAVKAVVYAICELLQLQLFVMTKGVQESLDLAKKIQSKLQGRKIVGGPPLENGLVVVADTAARIGKLVRMVKKFREDHPSGKFVVIADECDAMYRTEEGTQKMEKVYNELMDLSPCLRIEISATPMPTFLTLHFEKNLDLEMLQIGTSADYSGIEDMKPFQSEGEPVYLPKEPGDLKKFKEGVRFEWKDVHEGLADADAERLFREDKYNTFDFEEPDKFSSYDDIQTIPCTNISSMDFYIAAVSGKRKKGVLLLDRTVPKVKSKPGIFCKEIASVLQPFSRVLVTV